MKRRLMPVGILLALAVLPSVASAGTVQIPFPEGPAIGGSSITTRDDNARDLGRMARAVSATPQGLTLVSTSLSRSNIEVSCSSSATPDALSTFVLECYLQGVGLPGGRYDIPVNGGLAGPADTTVGARLDVPAQAYVVCMRARGVFRGGTDKDIITTPLVCM